MKILGAEILGRKKLERDFQPNRREYWNVNIRGRILGHEYWGMNIRKRIEERDENRGTGILEFDY